MFKIVVNLIRREVFGKLALCKLKSIKLHLLNLWEIYTKNITVQLTINKKIIIYKKLALKSCCLVFFLRFFETKYSVPIKRKILMLNMWQT